MASTDIVFHGLYYAIGATVTVVIGGLDCGDYVVQANGTDGTVTVPINSDPDGLCNGAYLQKLDVGPWDKTTYGATTCAVTMDINGQGSATLYIPVLIGFCYPSIGRLLKPATDAQIKSQQGGGTGKGRRVHNYGFQFAGVVGNKNGLRVGGDLLNMNTMQIQTRGGVNLTHNIVFQGVAYGPLKDNNSFDGQITWLMIRPYPCTINSITSFMDTEER